MGAAIVKRPELELDRDESKKLADAVQKVAEHYPTSFDPKKLAILNLCAVAVSIYWTRAVAIRNNVRSEAEAKRQLSPQPTPINRPSAAQNQPPPSGLRMPVPPIGEMSPGQIFGDQAAGL